MAAPNKQTTVSYRVERDGAHRQSKTFHAYAPANRFYLQLAQQSTHVRLLQITITTETTELARNY